MSTEKEASDGTHAELEALREHVRMLESMCTTLAVSPGHAALSLLLEHIPESVALLDREGRTLHVNHFPPPLTAAQVIGKPAVDFMQESQREAFSDALACAIRTGQPQQTEFVSITGRVWESRIFPLPQGSGVYAAIAIGSDVTPRKRSEEQLRQSQKLEAIGQLTAGVAHNFNNMLAVIVTNLAILRERTDDTLYARIREAEYAAERAADMIRDLMVFARSPGGRAVRREIVDLYDVTRGVAAMCRTAFDPRITIRLEKDAGSTRVLADVGQIEQVLFNVMFNARDALDADLDASPRIELVLDKGSLPSSETNGKARAAVRLRITDNGPGMSEEVRTRVFDPFYTTKTAGQATGLGLATAYGTMIHHRGTISCESQPGHGASFTLLFPLAQGEA